MSLPKPPVRLEGHCSIIFDNTLYVYTPKAFLSLPLKRNSSWKKLPMGEPVKGATCVKGSVDGNPNNLGFYVVGGKSSSPDYLGLQRYSFAARKWETIFPVTKDVQNRIDHAAIYLNASASLLVYAGSQVGDNNPSTQSFVISVTPPYNVQSYNSYVPPAFRPMLLPWSEDKAVMIGGSPQNTKVFAFSVTEGWHDTGAALPNPLPDDPSVQCAMVFGVDGSRILEIFDMGISPNLVTKYAMLMPGGTPAPPGQQVGADNSNARSKPAIKNQKRDVTLDTYPPYDNTFAPTTTRSGFSLAQDANGLVVISGGSEQDSLVIFDQSRNRWVDTSKFFVGTTTSVESTSTPTPSSTLDLSTQVVLTASSSPTSSETSSDVLSNNNHDSGRRTLTIIGATLGALLGLAALLIILLLLLGWRKRRNKCSHNGNATHRSTDGDNFDFQDQGMEPLTRNVQPMGRGPVPSTDSWAIVTGQVDGSIAKQSPTAFNELVSEKGRSPLRNVETNSPERLSAVSQPAMTGPFDDNQRQDRHTDEGWSKYFQANQHTNRPSDHSVRSTVSSQESKSDYRDSSWPHASAEVPALSIGTVGHPQPLGKVASGSPSTEHAPDFGTHVAQHGLTAKISSGDSISVASDDDQDDRINMSGPYLPHGDPNMPFGAFKEERVASSTYSASLYQPNDSNSFVASSGEQERPLTRWPHESQGSKFSEQRTPRAQLSSDISWLNLGKNR
ncbi:hypothetical protein DIZ76_016337 [Coccidioides immitis]|nr:hypothetical protein DIZ76_016337 [Coccidioides immitis]